MDMSGTGNVIVNQTLVKRKKTKQIVARSIINDIDVKYTNNDRTWLWKKWIFVLTVWALNAR